MPDPLPRLGDARLTELMALEEAATPAPWRAPKTGPGAATVWAPEHLGCAIYTNVRADLNAAVSDETVGRWKADAALIAALRTAAPALFGEILALRRDLAAAEKDREALIGEGSAAESALDAIAVLCGCPEWEYPAQIVRDVEALKGERDEARLEAASNLAYAARLGNQIGRERAQHRILTVLREAVLGKTVAREEACEDGWSAALRRVEAAEALLCGDHRALLASGLRYSGCPICVASRAEDLAAVLREAALTLSCDYLNAAPGSEREAFLGRLTGKISAALAATPACHTEAEGRKP